MYNLIAIPLSCLLSLALLCIDLNSLLFLYDHMGIVTQSHIARNAYYSNSEK